MRHTTNVRKPAADRSAHTAVLADAFGAFLPTLFVCYVFYRFAFRWVLPAFNDKIIDRTILFLAPFWIALLTNYTFDLMPIDRLTAADIKKTPGGLVAVIIIVIAVVIVAINQLRVARSAGWLPYYLAYYALGALVVLVLSQLPGLELRMWVAAYACYNYADISLQPPLHHRNRSIAGHSIPDKIQFGLSSVRRLIFRRA